MRITVADGNNRLFDKLFEIETLYVVEYKEKEKVLEIHLQ
jgi:hypothetical protein